MLTQPFKQIIALYESAFIYNSKTPFDMLSDMHLTGHERLSSDFYWVMPSVLNSYWVVTAMLRQWSIPKNWNNCATDKKGIALCLHGRTPGIYILSCVRCDKCFTNHWSIHLKLQMIKPGLYMGCCTQKQIKRYWEKE